MSGRMEWSEVAVDTPMHSNCGRSGHHGGSEKRARIIALQNEVVTKNLTSTSTITSTAATTQTFTVEVRLMIVLEIIGNSFLACLYYQWRHIRYPHVYRRCQWKMRVLEERMLLNLNLVIVFM